MKKHLAHALRRTARRMIAWSNRLDKPTVRLHTGEFEPFRVGSYGIRP